MINFFREDAVRVQRPRVARRIVMAKVSERVNVAVNALLEGNQRFAAGLRSIETMLSALRMKDLAEKGQKPFAIIVTCSDSRLPAEILFDRGVGDLFVIRMAGNVVTEEVIASIEFAALKFGTPLCLVMGHTKCGAMDAAHQILGGDGAAPTAYLGQLISRIHVPFERTRALCSGHEHGQGEFVSKLTEQNIQFGVEEILKRITSLKELASRGEFAVIGALVDLHQGRLTLQGSLADQGIEIRHSQIVGPAQDLSI